MVVTIQARGQLKPRQKRVFVTIPALAASIPIRECTCSTSMVTRYQKRISGPLLDRIDIHVDVPRVDYEKLADDRLG